MRKLIYVLPFAVMILSSCLKSPSDASQTTQIAIPVGTFAGQFRKIHRTVATGKYDTTKLSLNMIMGKDTSFQVTADTTTILAGSKGKYQITSNYIYFIDNTYPKTGTPTKIHLAGTFAYYYDGSSVFQIANITSLSDTIFYQYDMKKLY